MQDFLPLKCVTFPTMSFKTQDGMILVNYRRREKWDMCK
jgi:hypothetical protein